MEMTVTLATSGSSPQQIPEHSSPAEEVQTTTAGKLESTSTDTVGVNLLEPTTVEAEQ